MEDYIVRATAADNQLRAFAIYSRNLVEEARQRHNTSPVATAALGRMLSAAAMMGVMMKGDDDILTIKLEGDGPLGGVMVTADSKAGVKGYVGNPDVMLPPNSKGKLDVGGAVGRGMLTVIKDIGMKEPYSGSCEIVSGEIAEDLTYYFASSEQVASAVALGVLMEHDNTVKQAGGLIIQVMPFAEDSLIDRLEEKINNMESITSMLEKGMTPEDILNEVLGEFGLDINEKTPASFRCNCSKERVEKALISIGKKELKEMIEEGKPIELKCHFCNTGYDFSVDELKKILKYAKG